MIKNPFNSSILAEEAFPEFDAMDEQEANIGTEAEEKGSGVSKPTTLVPILRKPKRQASRVSHRD